jgi:O-antigen ligase
MVALAAAGGLATAFALFCFAGTSRAVWLFTALAWIPIGLVPVQGNQRIEYVLVVEILTTVLVAVWLVRRQSLRARPLVGTPFNKWLLALVVVSFLSLLSGMYWLDSRVPMENVKTIVSIGQILLIVWPIGLYFVVANSVHDERSARRITTTLVVLSLPSLAHPFLRGVVPLDWSVHIAVAAAPFCFASLLERRWSWWSLVELMVATSPLVAGMAHHKAYWYIAGGAGLLTVLFLKQPRSMILLALAAVVLASASLVASGDALPWPVRGLVAGEAVQQSIGGDFGRVRLALDGIRIWTGFPFLGVGPGNMWPYMHTYSVLDTTHNQYTNLLLELGIAGLACFLAFISGALRTGLRLRRRFSSSFSRTLALGWIGAFAGVVIGALTGDVLIPSVRNSGLETFGFIYPQWVLLGLLVGRAHSEGLGSSE